MESYDSFKLNEVDTSFVDSQILAPFCISWSRDNKVSLVVEGGIFIFELCPALLSNQQKVTFNRSWIQTCTSVPLSNVVNNENGTFFWRLERKQAFETCIDPTLSYIIQKPNITYGVSQVTQCEFSPLIGTKSYLSCLTNHGVLEIYKDIARKWVPVMNVTQLWISYCSKSFKDDSKNMDFQFFKSEMFRLKINTMKWAEKPEITLITGHENGEIVFWKVNETNENFGISVWFSCILNGKPSYLHLCSLPHVENSFLFIGKLSGIVQCLPVNLSSKFNYEFFNLWSDEDFFRPNLIVTKCLANKVLVFSLKQHVLLIQTLCVNNLKQLQLFATQWEEFPTIITGWNEYQNSFIISLQNHDIFLLNIKYNEEKMMYEKKMVDVEVKKKLKNSYCCYGLTMSQNKAIWITVSSPKQNYDSLKETTYLSLYSPKIKVFRSLTDSTSHGLIKQIMEKYSSTRLYELFDLLELMKLELIQDSTKFKDSYEINEDLPLLHFQLFLWEVKLKLLCNITETNSSLVNNVEFSITRKQALKVVQNFQKCNLLSVMQKRSLDVCQMLLMDKKEKAKSLDVACRVCGCKNICFNTRISSCSNHHKFPRCCLSLLPCDIVPYAVCKICESVALITFVEEGDNRCPYCDGILELDTKFHFNV